MKKIIAISLLMVTLTSSFSFAGALASNTVSTAGIGIYGSGVDAAAAAASTSPLFKLSTGVSVVVNFDAAGIGYAIFTKHLKGTKIFATAYDSTAIKYFVELPGVLSTTNIGSATAVPAAATWVTM